MAKPTHARANLPAYTSTENARRLVTTMSVFDVNRNKDRNCYGAEMIFVTILI
jgi:hypothetical protein